MFIEGQDSIKKELVKHFPIENFAWIDDNFLEEEEDEQEEEQTEDNTTDQVSTENTIDIENINVIEAREEETEDVPLVV